MRLLLAHRLAEQGIARDDKDAAALIMSGRVYVNGQRARAGQRVKPQDSIQVRGLSERYVSKGGLKLEGALSDFGLSPRGRVCIDAGASTGGFTHCLLTHGAQAVYAVDVGYGQLTGSLRQNPRVINMERTNIGDDALRTLDPVPDLGTCDLSYLSLRKGVPLFGRAMQETGDLICLVKPLFEVDSAQARQSGTLRDDAYAPLLRQLMDDLNALPGTGVQQLTHSPVTGNAGTREFFLHIRFGGEAPPPVTQGEIDACVARALAVDPYRRPGLEEAPSLTNQPEEDAHV
ncbi:MAG: TlyA family RNA methyltransferase [Clostridiales bacterium]|nr:TlyA family RNA methyltransferase [Clostridiales bacterium]